MDNTLDQLKSTQPVVQTKTPLGTLADAQAALAPAIPIIEAAVAGLTDPNESGSDPAAGFRSRCDVALYELRAALALQKGL